MKSIKNHLMFILPLMTILLSIEFFIVFDRVTTQYEEELKRGYTMLVVAKKPLSEEVILQVDKTIKALHTINREQIVQEIGEGIGDKGRKEVLASMPYFYKLSLGKYVDAQELESLSQKLSSHPDIDKVETFGDTYVSQYRLFSLIKFILRVFVLFMAIVSLFLVLKQMEIWRFEHKERMQVMEIFGAPLMLRSGVLLKIAFVDALVASLMSSAIFYGVKKFWAPQSGIDIVLHNQEKLFVWSDLVVLVGVALALVFAAVFAVITQADKEL